MDLMAYVSSNKKTTLKEGPNDWGVCEDMR
jgi:hypothetical protein